MIVDTVFRVIIPSDSAMLFGNDLRRFLLDGRVGFYSYPNIRENSSQKLQRIRAQKRCSISFIFVHIWHICFLSVKNRAFLMPKNHVFPTRIRNSEKVGILTRIRIHPDSPKNVHFRVASSPLGNLRFFGKLFRYEYARIRTEYSASVSKKIG